MPCYFAADGSRRSQTKFSIFRDISALLRKQSGGKTVISEHSLNRWYSLGSKSRILAGAGTSMLNLFRMFTMLTSGQGHYILFFYWLSAKREFL